MNLGMMGGNPALFGGSCFFGAVSFWWCWDIFNPRGPSGTQISLPVCFWRVCQDKIPFGKKVYECKKKGPNLLHAIVRRYYMSPNPEPSTTTRTHKCTFLHTHFLDFRFCVQSSGQARKIPGLHWDVHTCKQKGALKYLRAPLWCKLSTKKTLRIDRNLRWSKHHSNGKNLVELDQIFLSWALREFVICFETSSGSNPGAVIGGVSQGIPSGYSDLPWALHARGCRFVPQIFQRLPSKICGMNT